MIHIKKYIDYKFKKFVTENNKSEFNDIKTILVENKDVQIIYTAINNILNLKESNLKKDLKERIVEANILEIQILKQFKFYKNLNENIAIKNIIILTHEEEILDKLICLEHNVHTIQENLLLKDLLLENINENNIDINNTLNLIEEKTNCLSEGEKEIFYDLIDKDVNVLYREKANELINFINTELSELNENNERLKRFEVLNVLVEQIKSDKKFNVNDYNTLLTLL